MGLDMYIYRSKRLNGCNMKEIVAVENYYDWKDYLKTKKGKCTFQDWCGAKRFPSRENIKAYKDARTTHYYSWDLEKNYPRVSIVENIGYWRKANQVHKWFVDNVQNGEDNCEIYDVTKEQLQTLLDICYKLKRKIRLVEGEIKNGYTHDKNGNTIPIIEKGKFIQNYEVCEELLPTTSGFFFGSEDYDEYYYEDICSTIEILEKVIKQTDWDTEIVAYTSSW